MIISAVMLIGVHTLFALPILNVWWFATVIMIVLGIAFSLVPSAMWPSVPKIIPEKQLGTAYALIFSGAELAELMGVPLLIGFGVLNTYCKGPVVDGAQTYDYTFAYGYLCLFRCFGSDCSFNVESGRQEEGIRTAGSKYQKNNSIWQHVKEKINLLDVIPFP